MMGRSKTQECMLLAINVKLACMASVASGPTVLNDLAFRMIFATSPLIKCSTSAEEILFDVILFASLYHWRVVDKLAAKVARALIRIIQRYVIKHSALRS